MGDDAGIEVGDDAGVEAGDDAGVKAGAQAGDDAGDDAGVKAGVKAGVDLWVLGPVFRMFGRQQLASIEDLPSYWQSTTFSYAAGGPAGVEMTIFLVSL